MPDWISRLFGDLSRLWQKLTMAQKWMVGGLSTALFFALLAITLVIYVFPAGNLLYSVRSDAELGEIQKFLESKGVRYSVRDNGRSVYVNESPYKLRADFALASKEKPLGGYKVLLGPNWSQTSEQFRETVLRAQQEELAKTIEEGSDLIEWARVQLSPREKRLFPSDESKATASVKVGTGGGNLPRETVEGIQWLIANAVPGMNPADVVVTDENNRMLRGKVSQTETEQISTEQLAAERERERKIVEAVAAILDPIVGGSSNYVVTSLVKLNYDRKEITEHQLDTENPLEVRRKTEEIEDSTTGKAGAPGTPSNNPSDTIAQSAQSSGESSKMTQETRESEYEPRLKKETKIKVAPGAVLEQMVSIAINQIPQTVGGVTTYSPRSEEQMKALETQLMTAVGHIESSTRYRFSLNQYPFDTTTRDQAVASARWESIRKNAESAGFLLVAFLSIAIFFFFLKKVFTVHPEEEELVLGAGEAALEPHELTLTELGLRELGDVANLPPEEKKIKVIREQVETYAQQHPESVASILKNWLAE